jgi:hypothetical protein
MSHTFTILEGECDLEDDPLKDELDFSKLKVDVERTEKYRALARARLIRLAPDVAEVFATSEAVNEALRTLIRVMKATAGEVEQKAA